MSRRTLVVLLVIAAAAIAVYASGVLDELPSFETVIEDVAVALGAWTYALVGVLTFLETGAFVGLLVPGETTVIVGGVIAGQGEIDIAPLIGLVWACAILGDSTSFWIGRRLGRSFLLKHGPRLKITHERLHQVESYFGRHGGKTVLIGRFIGLVRALAPFIAGSSGMRYRRFLPYSVIGTGAWSAVFCLLGFIFYRSFSEVANIAGRASLGFAIVVGTIVAIVVVRRRLRDPEQRARVVGWIERRPGGAQVLAWLRFARNRLTPGELGIEFTTAVAAAVAGLYVFVLYLVVLDGGPALTAGDRMSLDLAADLRTDSLVDVAKVLTDFGAISIVGPLVAATAGLLAWRRRPIDAVALVGALVLVVVAVQLAKTGIGRERPEGGLTAVEGQSYPSGHAAYASAYVALAVAARRALPNLITKATLILAMAAVTVIVGLSRIYLAVHYWSDVAGGWGLGLGTFALCGALALLVTHIRHNGRRKAAVSSEHG